MSNHNFSFLDRFNENHEQSQKPEPVKKLATKLLTFEVTVKVEYVDEDDYNEQHAINMCQESMTSWKMRGTGEHLTPKQFKFIKSENI